MEHFSTKGEIHRSFESIMHIILGKGQKSMIHILFRCQMKFKFKTKGNKVVL